MKSLSKLPLLLGLLAFAFAFCLPVGRSFSDTIYLVGRVEAGAPPYYNVAFVPLGRLFNGLFGGWLGVEGALLLLSAAAVGGGVALAVALMLRLGASRSGAATAGLLLAFAPGVLFFGGVIEVHAVQFFGASLAVLLAWQARWSPPRAAWWLLGVAVLVAMLTHLSNLLLLPGLVVFAWRPEVGAACGCRFTRRGLPAAGVLVALAAAGVAALAFSDFATWSTHPALQWLGTLLVFGKTFLGGLAERGFFGAGEAAAYLEGELLIPFGLLTFGLLAGLALAAEREACEPRSFARRALVACLPALLVLPQGGVLERGGYFMSYAPLLAVLVGLGLTRLGGAGSERTRSAAEGPSGVAGSASDRRLGGSLRGVAGGRRAFFFSALLVGAQLAMAIDARQSFRASVPEARIWARAAAELVRPGDSILVSSLTRNFALAAAAPDSHVRDLARDLALVPADARPKMLEQVLAARLGDTRYPGDLWIDAELLPQLSAEGLTGSQSPTDFDEPWRAQLFRLLTEAPPVPVSLEPLDLGDRTQPGLAGFDPSRTPALIRIRRRP